MKRFILFSFYNSRILVVNFSKLFTFPNLLCALWCNDKQDKASQSSQSVPICFGVSGPSRSKRPQPTLLKGSRRHTSHTHHEKVVIPSKPNVFKLFKSLFYIPTVTYFNLITCLVHCWEIIVLVLVV